MIARTLLAAAIVASTVSGAANATHYRMKYNTSELTTNAGREIVAKRIERVAHRACAADPRFVHAAHTVRSCTSYVKKDLAEKVGDQRLIAMISGRTLRSLAIRPR